MSTCPSESPLTQQNVYPRSGCKLDRTSLAAMLSVLEVHSTCTMLWNFVGISNDVVTGRDPASLMRLS